MKEYDNRFKDAPWYEKAHKENILFIGAGGIGSNALHCLTKTIPASYIVIDMDSVEKYNIGTQFFQTDMIGMNKVDAVVRNSRTFGSNANITPLNEPYNSNMYLPIMITGLDNMKTRKQCFDTWKEQEDRELFIDGRLRANLYEIYVVKPGNEAAYEATLFKDSEADDGPCTFKQTAYFAMLIGARITQVVVNHLTNKQLGEDICVVPFKIKEISEPFYFEKV